jgi:hypothetical protein
LTGSHAVSPQQTHCEHGITCLKMVRIFERYTKKWTPHSNASNIAVTPFSRLVAGFPGCGAEKSGLMIAKPCSRVLHE